MGRTRAVVGLGFAVSAVALAVTLSHSPITVAAMNIEGALPIATIYHRQTVCQGEEALPSRVSAIRLLIFASIGPRVTLSVLSHGHLIAHGQQSPGWTSGAVTVPVHPLENAHSGVTLCFGLELTGNETLTLQGEPTSSQSAAHGAHGAFPGRVRVEYLRPGSSSWLSLASQVAFRMGLGRAIGGAWSVILLAALMLGVVGLSSRIVLRELR